MSNRIETGQIRQHPGTHNRFIVTGLCRDGKVEVAALDGGNFRSDKNPCANEYIYPAEAVEAAELIHEAPDFEAVAETCDVWNFHDRQTQKDLIVETLQQEYVERFRQLRRSSNGATPPSSAPFRFYVENQHGNAATLEVGYGVMANPTFETVTDAEEWAEYCRELSGETFRVLPL